MDRAILVGVIVKDKTLLEIEEHLEELNMLSDTAGIEVVGKVTQRLNNINASFFLGKGKAEIVINQAIALDANFIVFDDELSPAQIKNYHKLNSEIEVIDRSGIILTIFKKRAKTREAKTQVDLAYCQYLLPRLTRQWTHLERQMGGTGTRAGMGETQIEIDRRLIRTRISKLKKDLLSIEKERRTQSKKRQREYKISLVGYTNAGKSTLFKALTGSEVYIEDQLFATLDTTIRQIKFNNHHSALISDTVGFIRKLPHNLVASFKSTLKELTESDLIIIVLDSSSQSINEHLVTIYDVLKELGASKIPMIQVLNKIDLVPSKIELGNISNNFHDSILISAQKKINLESLISNIKEEMEINYETIELVLPYDNGKLISQIEADSIILEREYEDSCIKMKIRLSKLKKEFLLNNIEYSVID